MARQISTNLPDYAKQAALSQAQRNSAAYGDTVYGGVYYLDPESARWANEYNTATRMRNYLDDINGLHYLSVEDEEKRRKQLEALRNDVSLNGQYDELLDYAGSQINSASRFRSYDEWGQQTGDETYIGQLQSQLDDLQTQLTETQQKMGNMSGAEIMNTLASSEYRNLVSDIETTSNKLKNTNLHTTDPTYEYYANRSLEQLKNDQKVLENIVKLDEEDFEQNGVFGKRTGKQDDLYIVNQLIADKEREQVYEDYIAKFDADDFDGTYDATNKDTLYQMVNGTYEPDSPYQMGAGIIMSENQMDELTDEEKQLFNSIYKNEGKAQAWQYLEFLQRDLNLRDRIKTEAAARKFAEDQPFLSSLASVGAKMTAPVSLMRHVQDAFNNATVSTDGNAGVYQGMYSDNIDQNQSYFRPSQTATAIRSEISTNLLNEYGAEASRMYQGAMSVADNVAQMLSTGMTSEAAILAIMGSNVFVDSLVEMKDAGKSDGEAVNTAFVRSAIEVATEKIGLDEAFKFVKGAGAKQLLKAALAEGGEEAVGNLANLLYDVADAAFKGDQNQIQKDIEKYIALGFSESQAMGMVFEDRAKELGLDTIAGALSGFLLAGGNYAFKSAGVKTAQTVKEYIETDVDTAIAKGLEQGSDTRAYHHAQALSKTKNQVIRELQKVTQIDLNNRQETKDYKNVYNKSKALFNETNAEDLVDVFRNEITSAENDNQRSAVAKAFLDTYDNALLQDYENTKATIDAANIGDVVEVLRLGKDATFRTANGEVVSFDGIQFENQDQKILYQNALKGFRKTSDANDYLAMYKKTSGVPIETFDRAYKEAYRLGSQGFGLDVVKANPTVSKALSVLQEINSNIADDILEVAINDGYNSAERVTEGEMQAVKELAKSIGVEVEFVKGLRTEAGDVAEGLYNRETGVIKISTTTPNPAVKVFCHELTHKFENENPELYEEYKEKLLSYLAEDKAKAEKKEGATDDTSTASRYEFIREEVRNLYGWDINDATTKTRVDSEVVAILSENYLIDSGFVDAVKENKKLFKKLRASISFQARQADVVRDTAEKMFKEADQEWFEEVSKLWLENITRQEQDEMDYEEAKKEMETEDTEYGVNREFAENQYCLAPPYSTKTRLAEWLDRQTDEVRAFYDVVAAVRQIGTKKMGGRNWITKFMLASEWNENVATNNSFANMAKTVADTIPRDWCRDWLNEDGTIVETEFEKEFKMQRSIMQRIVDRLPLTVVSPKIEIDGKEITLSDKDKIYGLGGEAYRQAIYEERLRLWERERDHPEEKGLLKKKNLKGFRKDTWGTLGFLATNTKTGASGDFTTWCPQMFFNKGCFYCYRRAALESGVNNKLVAERVWYVGEILQLKEEDVIELNKKGGLRIQSFGDWMEQYSPQLAQMLADADRVGLQIKIITKEPSMIDVVSRIKEAGIGKSLYFNLSSDYVIEKAGDIAEYKDSEGGALPQNPLRPFYTDEAGTRWWKRALTVEEANEFRKKYPWVNTRIVATTVDEFIRGLQDDRVDVVTGYHGHIREYERVSSETGETLVQMEALGDSGMPRFAFDESTGEWTTEYEGKTKTHKTLAERIQKEGLQYEYFIKTCCITGRCAECQGKCGALAREFNIKNATNRDNESITFWRGRMESAVDNDLLVEQASKTFEPVYRDAAGKVVPIIDATRFSGNQTRKNTRAVFDAVRAELSALAESGETVIIEDNDREISFDDVFANEYTWSEDTKRLYTKRKALKANAAFNIKEIIRQAKYDFWEENKDPKKAAGKARDAARGIERYNLRFASPDGDGTFTTYAGRLVVRLSSDGNNYAYDLLNPRIEKEGIQLTLDNPSGALGLPSETETPTPSSLGTVTQEEENIKNNLDNEQASRTFGHWGYDSFQEEAEDSLRFAVDDVGLNLDSYRTDDGYDFNKLRTDATDMFTEDMIKWYDYDAIVDGIADYLNAIDADKNVTDDTITELRKALEQFDVALSDYETEDGYDFEKLEETITDLYIDNATTREESDWLSDAVLDLRRESRPARLAKLNADVLGDDLVVEGNKAVMTTSRIDDAIKRSRVGSNTDRAVYWITSIRPADFIKMTVDEEWQGDAFDRYPGSYDPRSNVNNYDYINGGLLNDQNWLHLAVDVDTGRVNNHEGRHRVRALEKAGIESVEILVELNERGVSRPYIYGEGNSLQTINSLELTNQPGTGQTATIHNLIPLMDSTREEVLENYGEGHMSDGDLAYSRTFKTVEQENQESLDSLYEALSNVRIKSNLKDQQIRTIAENLLRSLDAEYSVDALAENLKRVFAYWQKEGVKNYAALTQVMQDIMLPVVESMYDYSADPMKWRTIAGNTYLISSDTAEKFGGVNALNKNLTKKGVRFTTNENAKIKEGRQLLKLTDNWWNRISGELYEGVAESLTLDPEITNEADMVKAMVDAIRNSKMDARRSAIPAYAQEDFAFTLTLQAFDEFIKESRVSMDEVTRRTNANVAKATTKILRELREEYTQRYMDLLKKGEAAIELKKNQIQERADKAKYLDQLKKDMKRLGRYVQNPSRKNHIAIDYMKYLDQIAAIDITSNRKNSRTNDLLRQMSEDFSKMASMEQYQTDILDDSVSEMLDEAIKMIDNRAIRELNSKEIKQVRDAVRAFIHAATQFNELFDTDIAPSLEEATTRTIQDVSGAKGVGNSRASGVVDYWASKSLNPIREIARITDYHEDDPLAIAADKIMRGEIMVEQYKMEIAQIFSHMNETNFKTGTEEWKRAKEFRKRFDRMNRTWVKVTLGGTEMEITEAHKLSLIMHSRNADNMIHILYGGILVPNQELFKRGDYLKAYDRGKIIVPTEDELLNLSTKTDDFERWFLNRTEAYFEYARDLINRTSLRLEGFERALVQNYYPIRVADDFHTATSYDISTGMADTGESLKDGGTLKKRQQSKAPIYLSGINQDLQRHQSFTTRYAGLSIPLRDFQKLYHSRIWGHGPDVRRATPLSRVIRDKWTSNANKYIENAIRDVVDGRVESTAFDKFRARGAQAILTLNPSVSIKQAASFPTAIAELDYASVAKAMMKGGQHGLPISAADRELIAKWTPILWARTQGGSTQELAEIVFNRNDGKINRAMNKAPILFDWIRKMDVATVGRLWYATQYWVDSRIEKGVDERYKNLEKGSDDYYRAVARKFEDVVTKTQPSYTAFTRPDILRNKHGIVKAVMMFRTQPMQNFNILYESTSKYVAKHRQYIDAKGTTLELKARGEMVAARSQMLRSVSSQLIQTAVFTAMSFLANALIMHRWDKYRDDKLNEVTVASVFEQLGWDYLSSFFGNFFVLDWVEDVGSFATRKFALKDEDAYLQTLSVFGVDQLNGLIEMFDKIGTYATKGDVERTREELLKFGLKLTQLFGIPAENVYKMEEGIRAYINDIIEHRPITELQGTTNKQYWNRVILAYETGDDYEAAFRDMIEQTTKENDEGKKTIGASGLLSVDDESGIMQWLSLSYIDGDSTDRRVIDDWLLDLYQYTNDPESSADKAKHRFYEFLDQPIPTDLKYDSELTETELEERKTNERIELVKRAAPEMSDIIATWAATGSVGVLPIEKGGDGAGTVMAWVYQNASDKEAVKRFAVEVMGYKADHINSTAKDWAKKDLSEYK